MVLSGELSREADEGAILAQFLVALRKATTKDVSDAARREAALRAISGFEAGLAEYRRQLLEFKSCVAAADRKYGVTEQDYAACWGPLEKERAHLSESLGVARREYEAVVTEPERVRIADEVLALPVLRQLDETRAASVQANRRSRGVEGVVSERHLTLPRNVVSITLGPHTTTTFGQRYPSRIVEGGASYTHQNQELTAITGAPPEVWNVRGGVRVGVFDDFEIGALFLALQFKPKFRFDPVLIAFTQQVRFSGVDLAFRASFTTPISDIGWGLGPGVLLSVPGRRLALRTGFMVPLEVGTLRNKIDPIVGLNAPVRVVWNIVPSFFVSADSGVAYDRLAVKGGLTVPLGFGTGYSLLAGSKVFDFSAAFAWDHWLLPNPASGSARLEWQAYRIAFGASMYFQAL
ncbi:MAG TPA: hypothetical protein VFK05_00890 [Polyangiaceae bacterium]|nr:hypothetical protein [Polyangiaceae bacterium]